MGAIGSNMTVTASLVQTLHRINRQKTDLKGQINRGPKVVATAQTKLDAAKQGAQDIRDTITRMKIDADDKQLQMKEREDKIHHWKGQLNTVKENREFQALKDQIAADTQANSVLSDEILEILEGLDEMEVKLKAADENVEIVQDEFNKIEAQILEKRKTLESELERVEAELAEAEKQLTGDFRAVYFRLVEAKGEDAMAALEGNCCGSCYHNVTPQLLSQLGMGQPVLCKACGCLIYQDSDE